MGCGSWADGNSGGGIFAEHAKGFFEIEPMLIQVDSDRLVCEAHNTWFFDAILTPLEQTKCCRLFG